MSPDSLKAYVLWEAYPDKEKEAEIMVARRCAQIYFFELNAARIIGYLLAMSWNLKAGQNANNIVSINATSASCNERMKLEAIAESIERIGFIQRYAD